MDEIIYREDVLCYIEKNLGETGFRLRIVPGSFTLTGLLKDGGKETYYEEGLCVRESKEGELSLGECGDAGSPRIKDTETFYSGLTERIMTEIRSRSRQGILIYRAFEALYDKNG